MDNNDKSKEQQLQKINELQAKIVELEIIETKQKEIQKEIRSINQQLKISEKELIKEKEFSENLLDVANAFIINLDTNANITLFNKFAEKLTNYKKEEVLGKNWFDIFIPKRDDSVIHNVFSSLLKEMPEFSSYENPILCKSGSERLISWKNTVLKDDNKKISGMLSIGTDITQHKIVEKELSIKNEVFNASITANSTSDNEGILTYVNESFIKVFGYKNIKEAIGKSISDFLKFEDEAINIIKVLNESGKWEGEYTGLRKDGTTFIAHGLATIIKDNRGDRIGYQSVVQDITERKQVEKALLESEEKYRFVYENALVGIGISDSSSGILEANETMCTILGCASGELSKVHLAETFVNLENRKEILEKIKKDGKVENYEVQLYNKNKEIYWANLSTRLIEYKNPKALLTTVIDITKRKQAEEELKNHRDHLEELVRQRTNELEEKNKELERYNRLFEGREFRIKELKDKVKELEGK